jgi:thiamine transport system ATP-binding protein
VLDSVSLHVAAGEIVALLGPSGSGKSTLLRVIAGIVPADSGRVVLDGVDITSVPTHRRSVGMVFQNEQLFPHMDVAGNVGFGLRMAGIDRRARGERVAELLEMVGLAGFGSRHIDGLSGGERKRVALARSLAPQPKLLLLDEPLTGLDPVGIRRMKATIVRRAEAGSAVILSSHLLHLVEEICTRVLVMNQGRAVAFGTIPEIVASRPALHGRRLEDVFLALIAPNGEPSP